MSSPVTAMAPANIAFVKYWGARDLARAIPCNSSISMTLRRCASRCTVELIPDGAGDDEVLLRHSSGELRVPDEQFVGRVREHLRRLRAWAKISGTCRVATENTFPAGAGLASSASGFAALTLAAIRAMGLELEPHELSALARRSGSGSAARSVLGGYVEWPAAGDSDCGAASLAPADHWELRDVIALVETGPKPVSSLEGHRRAGTSPFFDTRLAHLPARLDTVRRAIRERDLERLGDVLEEEAVELHLIAMSSRPPIFYWTPGTLIVLKTVRALRQEGIAAYFTMDAGANVHVICEPAAEAPVSERLAALPAVSAVIRDGVGPGPRWEAEHLL